jgi:hypothetical protein
METVRGYPRGLPRNNSLLVHNADASSVPASKLSGTVAVAQGAQQANRMKPNRR